MACRRPDTKSFDEGEISASYQNEEFGVSETFWNFKLTHYLPARLPCSLIKKISAVVKAVPEELCFVSPCASW